MPKGNNAAWLRQQATQRAQAQRIAQDLAKARAAGGDPNDPATAMAQVQQMLQAIMTLRMRVDRLARAFAERCHEVTVLRAELQRKFMVESQFRAYRAVAEEKLGGKLAQAMIDGTMQWVVLTSVADEAVTSLAALADDSPALPDVVYAGRMVHGAHPDEAPVMADLYCETCAHARQLHDSGGCGMTGCTCRARRVDASPAQDPASVAHTADAAAPVNQAPTPGTQKEG